MLRISKRSDYGVFLLAYLARHDGRVVSAQELTRASGLHKSVIANILKDLARAGILRSVRGIHGGYRLARSATQINLRSILECFEGPVVLVDCADHTLPSGSQCSLTSFCPSNGPMRILQDRILALLEQTRLSDLALAPAPRHLTPVTAPQEACLAQVFLPSRAAEVSSPGPFGAPGDVNGAPGDVNSATGDVNPVQVVPFEPASSIPHPSLPAESSP